MKTWGRHSLKQRTKQATGLLRLLVVSGLLLSWGANRTGAQAAANTRIPFCGRQNGPSRPSQIPETASESDSGQLPRDAFQRLLYRLDHAPVNLDALEPGAKRGGEISQAGATFAAAMAPALPLLDRAAHSPTLGLLARIPVVGKPCAIAQQCMAAGKELGTGFTNLVGLDRKHIEPLRRAI